MWVLHCFGIGDTILNILINQHDLINDLMKTHLNKTTNESHAVPTKNGQWETIPLNVYALMVFIPIVKEQWTLKAELIIL